jgi:hypothetical protein
MFVHTHVGNDTCTYLSILHLLCLTCCLAYACHGGGVQLLDIYTKCIISLVCPAKVPIEGAVLFELTATRLRKRLSPLAIYSAITKNRGVLMCVLC